jgi:hypothetical protein
MNSVCKLALAMGLVALVGCGVEGPQGPEGEAGAQGPAGTSPVTDVQFLRFSGNYPFETATENQFRFNHGAPEHLITVNKQSWVLLDADMGFRKSTGTVGVTCELQLLKDGEVTEGSLNTLPATLYMEHDKAPDDFSLRTDGTLTLHGAAELMPGRYLPVARCSVLPGTPEDWVSLKETLLRVWVSSQ